MSHGPDILFSQDHYVHVPVPSPPHVVTKYHTQWNTVVDHASDTYEAWLKDTKVGWSENRLPMGAPIFSLYGENMTPWTSWAAYFSP